MVDSTILKERSNDVEIFLYPSPDKCFTTTKEKLKDVIFCFIFFIKLNYFALSIFTK